jgi:hypothetical protein
MRMKDAIGISNKKLGERAYNMALLAQIEPGQISYTRHVIQNRP